MCILNALSGDSKLEMGDGKLPLMLEVEGVKDLDVKKFNYRTKNNFSFPYMFSLSNPK